MEQKHPSGLLMGGLSFGFIGASLLSLVSGAALAMSGSTSGTAEMGYLVFPMLALGCGIVGLRQAVRQDQVTVGSAISGCAVVASILLIAFLAASYWFR